MNRFSISLRGLCTLGGYNETGVKIRDEPNFYHFMIFLEWSWMSSEEAKNEITDEVNSSTDEIKEATKEDKK